MEKPYPALCKDCKHGLPEEESSWNLKCHHPVVNANDPYALANAGLRGGGSDCSSERSKNGWFVNCGMAGKLWEPKGPNVLIERPSPLLAKVRSNDGLGLGAHDKETT